MNLLFFYSLRNLLTRRLTTALTALGMALVVFVFAAIIMLAEGLQKTLVDTGSYNNVVVIRKSSGSEVQSGIDRLQASIVETQPEIGMGQDGKQMLAKEMVVLITLEKQDSASRSNVVIRGVSRRLSALEAPGSHACRPTAPAGLIGNHGRQKHCKTVQGRGTGRIPGFRPAVLAGCRHI